MSKLNTVIRHITVLAMFLLGSAVISAAPRPALDVPLLYLQLLTPSPPVLSNIEPQAQDSGIRGAEVAIDDSNTTGRFVNHNYRLTLRHMETPEEILDQASQWIEAGNSLILAHLPAETLLKLSNHPNIKGKAVIINVAATDDKLRNHQCTSGLLHSIPSRAMQADALAQFLVKKRWTKWLLITAARNEDAAYSEALKRSAKRFGGKMIEEKFWTFDTDLRRTAQQELPLFTQGDNYDITLIADEAGDVGEYIPYNTWLPRPVAGTQGLTPVGWHRVVEQWGAIQLQNRFRKHAKRNMNSIDYAAWVAVRSIAEAVTRTNSNQADRLYSYIFSDQFQLAAFKGRKLSFRQWNGQLRQPIPLVHPNALVSQSPQIGFLHPHNELDTLGFDRAEVKCSYGISL
jgi:ABC transporter substrate binding protein (PQQ-dependent alcohol dehydrogenase system)